MNKIRSNLLTMPKVRYGIKVDIINNKSLTMSKTNCNNARTLSEEKFIDYLRERLDENVLEFISVLSKELDILVFSGVIRDFYLEHQGELRDLDLVVRKNFHQFEYVIKKFRDIKFIKNSFGGYKLSFSNITIDIWNAEDTWAFKERKVPTSMFYEISLTETCFFNFSSIVFDVKRKEFIKSKKFNSFLEKRTLDIVLEDNPYPELCIINTFYYQEKYKLKLSKTLKKYITKNFQDISKEKFKNIQIKHFNKVLYSHDMLINRVNSLLSK